MNKVKLHHWKWKQNRRRSLPRQCQLKYFHFAPRGGGLNPLLHGHRHLHLTVSSVCLRSLLSFPPALVEQIVDAVKVSLAAENVAIQPPEFGWIAACNCTLSAGYLVLNFFRFFFCCVSYCEPLICPLGVRCNFFSIFELHCKYLYVVFWAIVRSSVLYKKNILKHDPLNWPNSKECVWGN